jgi:hypothetical protein
MQNASDDALGTISAPAWYFSVEAVQDPYSGTMQAPQEAPAGTRYIGALVHLTNDSDQSLNFTPLDVRMRDSAGYEYRGGGAIGSEAAINPRNLNAGERSRGWVWCTVPVEAEIVEIVYVAPPSYFRLRLDD